MRRVLKFSLILILCTMNMQAMQLLRRIKDAIQHNRDDNRVIPYDSSEFIKTGEYEGGVKYATISPDQTKILSVERTSINIRTIANGNTKTYENTHKANYAAFSSDGNKALIGAIPWHTDNMGTGFEIIDLEKDTKSSCFLDKVSFEFLAFTPDDKKIIAVNNHHQSFAPLYYVVACISGQHSLANEIAQGMSDHNDQEIEAGVNIIDVGTGAITHTMKLMERNVSACFVRNSVLYALLRSGIAQRMDLGTYTNLPDVIYKNSKIKEPNKSQFLKMAYADASNDKMAIIVNKIKGAKDDIDQDVEDCIKIHDLVSGDVISTFACPQEADNSGGLRNFGPIAISSDGKIIAFGADGTGIERFICIASLEGNSGTIMHRIPAFIYPISITFSPGNRTLFVFQDHSAIIDVRSGKIVTSETLPVRGYFSGDGSQIVMILGDRIRIMQRKIANNV